MSPTSEARAAEVVRTRCSHRGAARRAHLAELAQLSSSLAGRGAARVVVQCESGAPARAQRAAVAEGGERVHVRLDGAQARAQARRLVAAAVAYQGAGAGPGPRQGAASLLFREAPIAADSRCVGHERCAICFAACPSGALRAGEGGLPRVAGRACRLCGTCVQRCPWNALSWSHAPAAAIDARLRAALAGPERDGPWAVLLEEREAAMRPGGWEETIAPEAAAVLPIRLPRGTLGAGMILRALELGAGAVGVVIPAARPELRNTVEAIASLVAAAGLDELVVLGVGAGPGAAAILGQRLEPTFHACAPGDGVGRCGSAMAATARLWRDRDGAELVVDGDGAWAGWVTADAERCHLCGACARSCPTAALALATGSGVSLQLDPSRCPAGCGRCAQACPRQALRVAPSLRLPWRTQVLVPERRPLCPRCGGAWEDAVTVPGPGSRPGGAWASVPQALCPRCRRERLTAGVARLFRPEPAGSGEDPPADHLHGDAYVA